MPALRFLLENARWLSAGALLTLLSSFGQTYFISIFAGEIRAEYGLSHGDWGGIYAIGTLASAAVMIWAGALTDRWRVRAIGPVVLAGLAAACLLMAGNRWGILLPVVVFLLRLGGQGMASHIARVAMARWFVATRGKALAVSSMGFALGEATLPILAVLLMAVLPWRYVWVGSAVFLVAMIPVLLWLLREERTPQSQAHENHATGRSGRHWRRGEVLRDGVFWMLMPLIIGPPAFGTAFFFHQVHLTESKGWAHVEFVAMIPFYTATALLSTLVFGWAIDKWGSLRLLPLYQLPYALGFVLLSQTESLQTLFLIFLLAGLAQGGMATLLSAFWAELYGTAHLGAIKALASAVMVMGSAIGPGITGALIDAGIPFAAQGPGVAVYVLISCALAALGLQRLRRVAF